MTDDRQDFVPIEPTPAVAQPAVPAQPAGAVPPPPPPGYYNPTPPAAPAYGAGAYTPPAYVPPAYNPGAYPGQYQAYAPPQPPSGLAITAMILGIIGALFSFVYGIGLFPAIAAVITGHIARKKQAHARGFWMAALITGYIGIAFSLIAIAGIIVFAIYIATTAHQYSDSSSY